MIEKITAAESENKETKQQLSVVMAILSQAEIERKERKAKKEI